MKKLSLLLGAIALTATASPVLAKTVPARMFVAQAGASDLFERQSSQLVIRSTDPHIRSFAQMMVRDHTASTADVKMAARRGRVPVGTPRLNAKQTRDLAMLRRAAGQRRDRLYVEQQRMAHDEALALHSGYAAEGDVPSLRMAAAKIVPVVTHHREMLGRM